MVESEPVRRTGSGQKVPAPAGSATLLRGYRYAIIPVHPCDTTPHRRFNCPPWCKPIQHRNISGSLVSAFLIIKKKNWEELLLTGKKPKLVINVSWWWGIPSAGLPDSAWVVAWPAKSTCWSSGWDLLFKQILYQNIAENRDGRIKKSTKKRNYLVWTGYTVFSDALHTPDTGTEYIRKGRISETAGYQKRQDIRNDRY